MKTTPSQRIKIGLFTLIGLIILITVIFFIGSQKSLFSSTLRISGVFNNVNGLQAGNNVRLAGINIGVVDEINILSDTSVSVTVMINKDVEKFIKKDARLSIGSDGLMGDKLIVIMPGGANTTATVVDGDRIAAVNPMDVDKIIGRLTNIAGGAESLINNLSEIAGKINKGQGSLGRLLNSNKMADEMESTVSQAKRTMKTVNATTVTLNDDLKAAQSNFLLKGFFNKKKKAEKAKQDSIRKVKEKAEKDAAKKLKEQQKD